ncbi:MAG: hypothetical protein WBQ66_07250, partial [Blastocatellia bacterium]
LQRLEVYAGRDGPPVGLDRNALDPAVADVADLDRRRTGSEGNGELPGRERRPSPKTAVLETSGQWKR